MNDSAIPLGAGLLDSIGALAVLGLRSIVLLALAFMVHFALGKRRALARTVVWNASLIGLFALPIFVLGAPPLKIPVFTSPAPERLSRTAGPTIVEPDAAAVDPTAIGLPVARLRGESKTLSESKTFANASGRALPSSAVGASHPAAERSRGLPSVSAVVTATYALICGMMLLRVLGSLIDVRRLLKACSPIMSSRWEDSLSEVAARVGVRRRVRLLANQRISTPAVVGALQPAILLPSDRIEDCSAEEIEAILMHELAHVRRCDYAWRLISRIARAVYWPNPLVWLADRAMARTREQACDDFCVAVLGDAGLYGDLLLELARSASARRSQAVGLAMAGPAGIGERLAWIAKTPGSPTCTASPGSRFAFVALIAALAYAAGAAAPTTIRATPARQAEKPARAEEPRVAGPVEITVTDKDSGKPLRRATIRYFADHRETTLRSDGQGRLVIDPSKTKFDKDDLLLDIWAEGYVQQRLNFTNLDPEQPRVPAKVSAALLKGSETYGGRVTDETGRPIAGVSIKLWGHLQDMKVKQELVYMIATKTDAAGMWSTSSLRPMRWINLYLSHPDFASDGIMQPRVYGRDAEKSRPLARLQDRTDVQVMKKGVPIAGVVRDKNGAAIAGAEISWRGNDGSAGYRYELEQTKTDARGAFRFSNARPGKLMLLVTSERHAPDLLEIDAKPGLEPISVTLDDPMRFRGRVTDSSGKPIEGVTVNLDSWRNDRTWFVFLLTDSDGGFEWTTAPRDSFLINISKPGYLHVFQKNVSASDESQVITLEKALTVNGKLVDAATRKPILGPAEIERSEVIAGSDKLAWIPLGGAVLNSRLNVSAAVAGKTYRFRIKAPGYKTFETRDIKDDEGTVVLDIPLEKDSQAMLHGTVLAPDGKPVPAADVVIAEPDRGATIAIDVLRRARDTGLNEILGVSTDEKGGFELARTGEAYKIAAAHPLGFVWSESAEFEKTHELRLQPWGAVEGVLYEGSKPAAGQEVSIEWDQSIGASWSYKPEINTQGVKTTRPRWSTIRLDWKGETTTTDANGRFRFKNVPPVDIEVLHVKNLIFAHKALEKVEPGKTLELKVGGTGRPVIGRFVLPDRVSRTVDWTRAVRPFLQSSGKDFPYPKDRSLEERNAWVLGWWNSPEGKALRASQVSRPAVPDASGRFRSEDVPAGAYKMKFSFDREEKDGSRRTVATVQHDFQIPEIPGGRSDEPLDLGNIEVSLVTLLEIGQTASEFAFTDLEGKPHALSDYKGKFVLLDFWASWCGPCVFEIPFIKAVHDKFAKDERFVIVGLSLDEKPDDAKTFLEKHDEPWLQGFLGSFASSPVAERYEIGGIPSLILIGPDGKVVAKNLRGELTEAAVAKALATAGPRSR